MRALIAKVLTLAVACCAAHGDINEALLYATIAVVGTHAAVWTTR